MIEQFPRFTAQANNAVYMARRVALWLKHNSVDPDILLLGIIGEHECSAAKTLANLGVEFNNASAVLINRKGFGTDECDLKVPLTASVKEIFDNARLKSVQPDVHCVSSNLLLWVLLSDKSHDNNTRQILTELNVDVETLLEGLLQVEHNEMKEESGVLDAGRDIQWKAVFAREDEAT